MLSLARIGLCWALSFMVPGFGLARDGRHVSGTVFDSDGIPVPHASVAAFPATTAGTAGNLTWINADEHGRFQLELTRGKYCIRAKKESEGYPDPMFLLSADPTARFPEVTVEGTNVNDLQVLLGIRGGVLSGSVMDEVSRTPVKSAKVTVRDARAPASFVELTSDDAGRFSISVPHKAVVIEASAKGHRPTRFQSGAEVTLSGGEHREIEIDLRPE